jgi:TolA-binding protein
MKNYVFLSLCMMLVAALVSAHALFKTAVTPVEDFQSRIRALDREKQEAELKAQIYAYRLAEFRQDVASLLPDAIRSQPEYKAYPLRQLASVSASAKGIVIERASSLMEKGKAEFREGRHEEAGQIFRRVISHHPDSLHVIEAHFLLAESQYQLQDFDSAIATVERMVDLFPENELTGFALLRLGSIFEVKERFEDAGDIYKAILSNFKNQDLSRQAQASLKAVRL